jgi:ComF family protein
LWARRGDVAVVKTISRLLSRVARALGGLLTSVLSPAACAACDAPTTPQRVFCQPCAETVLRAAPCEEALAIAFAAFGGAVATALKRFKYEDRPDLARPLGHLLRRAAREAGLSIDVVVPVPLHPRRLVERGYNQAALLARAAAVELDAQLSTRALARVRGTAQQARLGREARRVNMAGAFEVRDAGAVRGRRVLLVDDVETTGATLKVCREALLAAGAASVTALVVARAGRPA